MSAERKDVVEAITLSLKAIDDDYREEMRELRALYEQARIEAAKDEPNDVKLKVLLKEANEVARTFATLDPLWAAVQRVSRLFGLG